MRTETIGDATLYLGDCLEILPQISGVDAVITDPPYSSGGAMRGDRTVATKQKYVQTGSISKLLDDFSGDTRDQRAFHFWSALWSSAAMQASKPGAIGCFFSDWRQLPISTDYMQAGGWVWRGIVPWAKPSYRPQIGRFGAQCEYLIWGSNGPLPMDREVGCLPGFFDAGSLRDRDHITQKPVELMDEIVQIVPPGGTVLDPFMGSGTTGVSCLRAGRKFVGVELIEAHFVTACRRLEQAHAQGQLFARGDSSDRQIDIPEFSG